MGNKVGGTITVVQEERFQLVDDDGVAHLFILDHHSELEPDDLRAFWREGRRVSVRFEDAPDLIARIARKVNAETTTETDA